ncbi:MAG: sister chromatid cohesion protein PDS5, partial [Gemmataceae bacterium]|nr:sister chromatid cohesion protein PDS5 [Gemmataceae bacterium]
ALVPDLGPLVTDPEVEVRRDVVYLLRQIDGAAVFPLLRQSLTDSDEEVRARAVEVLVRRADTSDETIAALAVAVEDRAAKVRRNAIDALGKLLKVGTPAVLKALETAQEDDDKKVAERAGVAFRKLTPKEPKKAAPRAKKRK